MKTERTKTAWSKIIIPLVALTLALSLVSPRFALSAGAERLVTKHSRKNKPALSNVGADLCVCPGFGVRHGAGADTQVCPGFGVRHGAGADTQVCPYNKHRNISAALLKPSLQAVVAPRQDYAAAVEMLERFIANEMADKELPALSIALVDDQRIVWAKGFGFADPKAKVPASAETVYRVGSVSKLFTDIAIMQLVEQGKIDLDAPITRYLSDFRPRNPFGKPITLRQLMSHRSGLVREPPVGNYFETTEPSLARTIASLNDTELVYAPASRTKYSNAAIAAVGYALERTQGEPFAKYLKRAVLDPLGLAHSSFEPAPEITAPVDPQLARRIAGRYMNGARGVDLIESGGRLSKLGIDGGEQAWLRSIGDALIVDDKLAYGEKILAREGAIVIGNETFKRIEVPEPRPAPAGWRGLIGEYGWDHDILYIFEKDGKLWALIEWFEFDPLEQVSENVFKFPNRGLYDGERLIFTRDKNGRATQVEAASVVFKRRNVGPEEGSAQLRIKPLRPVSELLKESLAAQPPKETGEFREPDLVDLTRLDPTIKLDIRYATTNNFLGSVFYSEPRAFLQRPAAGALVRAHKKLRDRGYGLLIHDAYRPWYVTKVFWDATPEDKKLFVADPSQGSRHNRGAAVDLTLYDLKTGKPVEMVGTYDETTDRSYPDYPGGDSLQRWRRNLLRDAMESEGFTVFEAEWWHFDYKDWQQYPIGNLPFDKLRY